MRARRRSALLLAAATLALAACAPAARGDWAPPAWQPSAVHVTDAPGVVDASATGPHADTLRGLRLRNDAIGVHAMVALLPETPQTAAFNAAVRQHLSSAIDARVAATGVAYIPTAAPPGAGLGARRCLPGSTELAAEELLSDDALGPQDATGTTLVCDIVTAAGPMFGERLRLVSGTAEGAGEDASTIIYADTASGEVVTADALWVEGAVEALSTDIVEAVRRDAGALSIRPATPGDEAQLAAVRAALASTVPTEEGAVITLPAGFTAPELVALGVPATTEPMTFAVPSTVAGRLMTPFGIRLLDAVGEPYAGPRLTLADRHGADCRLMPCVAVTYDDGPSGYTAGILDELADRDAAATFFALGSNAQRHRDVLARMTLEGHQVANHTWNHPQLPLLTAEQVAAQISDTTRALEAASGQPILAFRPPYGAYNEAVVAAAHLPAILWDVDTNDWQRPARKVLIERAVEEPRAGSIVLMHDIHSGTADAAGDILDGLLDRGFSLVTVQQLFGGALPTAGAWSRAP